MYYNVLNFAATTNFDERYDVALETNTMGALRVLSFAKKCVKINMILHVSTAYVCGERSGVITEKPFYMGESLNGTCKLDITAEKKLVEEKLNQLRQENANEEAVTFIMKDLGIERTIDSVIIGYGQGKLKCLPVNPDAIFDLIPADMVVDTMLMVMVVNANQLCSADSILIYHVGSSVRNPIKFSNLHKFSYCYFTKNPYIDRNGKAVQISKGTVLTSWAKFQRYMAIRYLLPLKGLKLMNSVFCLRYKNICINSDRKTNSYCDWQNSINPICSLTARKFDDSNTEKLRMKIRESGLEKDAIIGFDPKCINWEDYIINIHIPRLVKYAIKY
ncbi:hypothetical protein EZV62_002231 [Acer yangbiense]|uniref:Fatty acyl-CoA reductase n=1 Tax=Acer yangbiense TaxID=1000413 RepID=A0A5C7IYG3_9ROSI|nr:hypothetical protein EZV62_002231 [Acer yangbiense]